MWSEMLFCGTDVTDVCDDSHHSFLGIDLNTTIPGLSMSTTLSSRVNLLMAVSLKGSLI